MHKNVNFWLGFSLLFGIAFRMETNSEMSILGGPMVSTGEGKFFLFLDYPALVV